MNKTKNGFIFYNEYKKHFNLLKNPQDAVDLLFAIIDYHKTGSNNKLSAVGEMAFSFIKVDIDNNNEKYQKICERNQKNGNFGGRPKTQKTQSVILKPKKPDTDTDTDTERDIERDKEIKKEKKEKDNLLFCECWDLFGKYGNKNKANEYWNKLNEKDKQAIKEKIPIYLLSLESTGFSKKMMQGWINPKERMWETTYENNQAKPIEHADNWEAEQSKRTADSGVY